jgi:sulfide:quinone oxidoreductase
MTPSPSSQHHRIVVIGGGNGGLSVAGRLARYGIDDIAVIEPRSHHLYQPLFSHVAGGTARASQARRPQRQAMPNGVEWVQDSVESVDAGLHRVTLVSGSTVGYDHLIVAAGIENRFDLVPGLSEAIATPSVASHYDYGLVPKASRLLKNLRSGAAVFTEPSGPTSCAGASQKPMYLACAYWAATGVLDRIRVVLVVPSPTMFGIPMIDAELERKVGEYGIEVRYSSELSEVDAAGQTAVIRAADGSEERIRYDVLNAVPPQRAPAWIGGSGLSSTAAEGFVAVDPLTLRHQQHPDIWSLGDCAATTNSKSGGALRQQTKTLANNLRSVLQGKTPTSQYNGYSVAPFTVSRGTVVFAEFDDQGNQKPTIPFWKGLARERRMTWVADRYVLPWVYWHMIVKGRA